MPKVAAGDALTPALLKRLSGVDAVKGAPVSALAHELNIRIARLAAASDKDAAMTSMGIKVESKRGHYVVTFAKVDPFINAIVKSHAHLEKSLQGLKDEIAVANGLGKPTSVVVGAKNEVVFEFKAR